MALLHNRVSQKELKKLLFEEKEPRVTLSFYKYASIDDPQAFRDEFYKNLNELKAFGRIYVAHEGINAQMSVPAPNFEKFKEYLDTISFLKDVRLNIAVDYDARLNDEVGQGKSFWVLKVKVRNKIVADGITDPAFDMSKKGKYVDADSFNKLTADPDTIVVDMRNHYEYEVGHFVNAIEIPSDTFRQQLPMAVSMLEEKKDKNIIMYCTGGIRCEKASAYMLHNGFKNVYHLEGGIIQYANKIKEEKLPNKFLGKNFVFDGRLGEKIGDEIISHCHQCGAPCDTHTNCANEACHLLFIQCESCAAKYEGCCSEECQSVNQLSEEEKKEKRKGIKNGIMIFNKSRERMNGLMEKK
ncbi:MAG: rhodanese-related sulfurtransferase [Bacteroidota bacterium]|nr:rhodanese-related sulfurtransferase [Bacteroidota bacterium]